MRLFYLFLTGPLAVALAGCAGSGLNSAVGPFVRGINANPTNSLVNIQEGGVTVATNLPYATESGNPANPYVSVPQGSQVLSFTSGGATVASTNETLTTSNSINAVALPTGSILTLSDDTSLPADAEVRVVNASSEPQTTTFTFSLNGTGPAQTFTPSPVFPVQPAFPAFLYQTMATGTYKLTVALPGPGAVLLTESVTLNTGKRWTFILVNGPSGGTPILVQVQDSQQTG